ncbi:AAA family ATPase [Synechococcus sp. EJ6-Ellesmere]|uniref:AAA family ATPase n=1 Tax=Synechococcus sp. EJ6-Ellesmere TaxID=2823734 RepID=UPI0020CEB284|nr:AAA family ATPase [Synechococcus sp. EJ6-Ellesmere]MCP9825039.1 ATP-binding protein [Synechococcus sp. EJ6-Ellesmere]
MRADSQVTPLRLFVGRQRERQLLLTTIGSSASSRQAVAGRPGIGKTTLVQTVKANAQAGDYWSSDEIIPINAEGASEHLLGQLLSGVYDAVLANCPTAAGPEVEAAQQLVRSIRLRGGSQSESVAPPPGALLLDGPRVLRDLLRYAIGQGARGIVLHLNNLENLSEADASRHDGLHLIVVGTTDAVRTVVLKPLALRDVEQLLANRYEALQLDPSSPWRSPVDIAVVQRLYELFRGDLRGLLKALEDGITALLGLTSAGAEVAPVGLDDLLLTLRQRNQAELREQLGDTAWERLLGWAKEDSASTQTQAQLVDLWQGKQPSVSQTLQQLIEAGAVDALPRRGREAIQYLMTGTARLAL